MYDLIILGGGPAGISAGIYASRKKINALLITKDFGGQSIVAAKIENFIGSKEISGIELAKTLEEHLRAQNSIEIKEGVSVIAVKKADSGYEVEDSNGSKYLSKNLLITIGSSYKKLSVIGEKEFAGKGVFYCSICDAPLMKGKPAVVIGGGNSGLDAVMDLLPYASDVYLLNRSELKGDAVLQEKIKADPKVKIITNVGIEEIFGDMLVSGLKYKELNSGEIKTLDVSGIFVEIGYSPNTELVKDLVNLSERGEIIVDHKTMQTSAPGIWAAGDITDGLYNQINTSIGDGIKAVLNIYNSLKNQ